MRNNITKLLMIIIIIATLICGVTLCYTDTRSSTTETTVTPTTITPTANYMQFSSPSTITYSGDTMIIANNKSIYISRGTGLTINAIPSTSNENILQIAASDSLLAVLSSTSNDEVFLKVYSTVDGAFIKDISSEFTDQVRAIAADSTSLYIIDYKNTISMITDIEQPPIDLNFRGRDADSELFDVHNDSLYIYRKELNGALAIYEYKNQVKRELFKSPNIISFSVSDSGIFYITSDNKVELYSFTTSSIVPTSITQETPFKAIAAVADKCYVTSPTNNRVLIISLSGENTLSAIGYYGDKGNEIDRFNSPLAPSILSGDIVVADSGNNRIIATNKTTLERRVLLTVDYTIINMVSNGEYLVTLDSTLIMRRYRYKNNELTAIDNSILSSYSGVSDMEVMTNGDVYLLVSGGNIIKAVGSNITALYTHENAKQISLSGDNYLYIAATTKLIRYNFATVAVDTEFPITASIISDFFIDFSGNAYYLAGNILKHYTRSNMVYTLSEQFNISLCSNNIKLGYDISLGDLYITDTTAHKLLKLNSAVIKSMSTANMNYTHPNQDDWRLVTAHYIIEDTYLLSAPNNDEAITQAAMDTIFLALAEVTLGNTAYYYGKVTDNNDAFYYIPKSKLTAITKVSYGAEHPAMSAIYSSGASVYKFPYRGANVLTTATKDTPLQLIDNVAHGGDTHLWKWYKVSLVNSDGSITIGYADASDIYYSGISTPPKNKKYLKVNSEKFGQPVIMYRDASVDSEVLFNDITDGARVMLSQDTFDTSAEFTKVTYNNVSGYIKTTYLKAEGLTNNQQLALILTASSVAVLAIVILLIFLSKKLRRKPQVDGLDNYDTTFTSD